MSHPAHDPRPPASPGHRPPNRHKMTILTWVGIYPTITCLLLLLGPFLLGKLPVPAVTLVLTAIMVPTMSYLVMPMLMKFAGDWLYR